MTPDEHEARLRDAVHRAISDLMCRGYFGLPSNIVDTALDTYAEWLRLRAVADIEYCLSPMTKCEHGQPGGYYKGRLCEVHEAQQQIAAILAAGGADAD